MATQAGDGTGMAGKRGDDTGVGLGASWAGAHSVVDHWAKVSPQAKAIEDANGVWSYVQLQDMSLRVAMMLCDHGLTDFAAPAPSWERNPAPPRPLALWVDRGREFFALCVGAYRLGLPVAAMSRDMANKSTEEGRNKQVVADLNPVALIGDEGGKALLADSADILFISYADVSAVLQGDGSKLTAEMREAWAIAEQHSPTTPQSVMAYVYTGGTTKASKCVAVTHAMALWEAEHYSTALGAGVGQSDKFLQYSSLYWGAAVFGQISVALAVGACVCIGGSPTGCRGAGDALQQIVMDVESFGITVLGIVPSQLRGAWPGGPATAPRCLRALIVWADKCPVELSRTWRASGLRMIDLLTASEYWLTLYSDCTVWSGGGVEKHIYRKLPSLDARFLVDDGGMGNAGALRDARIGEAGEMYLSGPTTSPGYVCPDGRVSLEFHGATRVIDGKTYLRTRDILQLLPGGGLVYAGRADSMMKHGGQWMDTDALQDAVTAVPGVTQAAIVPGAQGVDAFVVLRGAAAPGAAEAAVGGPAKRQCIRGEGGAAAGGEQIGAPAPPPFRVLAKVQQVLPGAHVHVCTALPLNPVTAKVDSKALAAQLASRHEHRQQHLEAQQRMEQLNVRCYGAWASAALGLVCALELALGLLRLAGGLAAVSGGAPPLLALLQLAKGCATRLAVLPQLWAACTYLEFSHNSEALVKVLGRFGLPTRWSTWLPLVLAALLPTSLLKAAGITACSYLGWARERDALASLGAGALAAALSRASVDEVGVTLALLGLVTAAVSPHAAGELVTYLLSTPGLFYQVLPKYLSDEFGWRVERRGRGPGVAGALCRSVAWLQPPTWSGSLSWDRRAAVVDPGNRWDQVYVEGTDGQQEWMSVGIVVNLNSGLLEDESLATALGGTGSTSSGDMDTISPVGSSDSSNPLVALVERICGRAGGDLHGLESLQAIQLTEAVRREFHKPLSVTGVLRCTTADELLEVVQALETTAPPAPVGARAQAPGEREQHRRVWLCGMGSQTCTVDWMVNKHDKAKHLDVPALQRALGRLVARHEALRARNAAEEPMFEPTYSAASLWQLWCSSGATWTRTPLGKLAASSVYWAWPRSRVLPCSARDAAIELCLPTVGDMTMEGSKHWGEPASHDERAFWVGGELLRKKAADGSLFQVGVIPVFQNTRGAAPGADAASVARALPPGEVQWYIYAILQHGYCDGPTSLPLFADLLRLYAEEAGEAEAQSIDAPDALATLQRRLQQSLKPMPEAEHPNDDIFHDGLVRWGFRRGFQRLIRFDASLMKLLRFASREMLGCSVDVAWLTVIAAAFLRMFPQLRRLDLFLIVTCRDRPGEERMIGYFSSRKMLALEVGDPRGATILGLSDMISATRRRRAWSRPRPFEKCGACIEVNVVSQAADGLPFGFQEVRCARSAPRQWERGNTSCMNLRLDQSGRDDWDFRLQSHDAAYGAGWSTYYAQAMGSVLVDMAVRPTGPVVPSP